MKLLKMQFYKNMLTAMLSGFPGKVGPPSDFAFQRVIFKSRLAMLNITEWREFDQLIF